MWYAVVVLVGERFPNGHQRFHVIETQEKMADSNERGDFCRCYDTKEEAEKMCLYKNHFNQAAPPDFS